MKKTKPIKRELYRKAVRTVYNAERCERLRKIMEEHEQLLYESMMQPADREVIKKIKAIRADLPAAHSMGKAALNNHLRSTLDTYVTERRYHPLTLREIEKYVKTGQWPESLMQEV